MGTVVLITGMKDDQVYSGVATTHLWMSGIWRQEQETWMHCQGSISPLAQSQSQEFFQTSDPEIHKNLVQI